MFNPLRSSDGDFPRRTDSTPENQGAINGSLESASFDPNANDARSIAIPEAGEPGSVRQELSELQEINFRRQRTGRAAEDRLTPPQLQRDELIELCNLHLGELPALLKGDEIRIHGEITEATRRLLLPNRRPGEGIFTLDEVEQFAVYIGLARPEAAEEIAERDNHIVSTLTPGEEATPLCYYSAKQTDKAGNEFWLNIVLWNQKKMGPTRLPPSEQKHWDPPAEAGHPDTVRFALYGHPERGEAPAFSEVHFMFGSIDEANTRLVVEEYRLSRTPTTSRDGQREIFRYTDPQAYGRPGKRWGAVANEPLPRIRRSLHGTEH